MMFDTLEEAMEGKAGGPATSKGAEIMAETRQAQNHRRIEDRVTIGQHPAASLEQMSGAIGYCRQRWGDWGYRLSYHGSDMFVVVHRDMKWDDPARFYVDRYGEAYELGVQSDGRVRI